MKKLIAMLLLASLMMSIAVSACADGTIDQIGRASCRERV